MEPDWGKVENLLGNGMGDLRDFISTPTWKQVEADISAFKYGEVYDLLSYIDKTKKTKSSSIEEAGYMMGFPPQSRSESPAASTPAYARKLTKPCKTEFPLDWSEQRIQQEVESIGYDQHLAHRTLFNGCILREDVRSGVNIRVIYQNFPGHSYFWCEYPLNAPRREQTNRLGAFRDRLEEAMLGVLDDLKSELPTLDYEIYGELIRDGQYRVALALFCEACEHFGVEPENMRPIATVLEWCGLK